MNLNLVCDIYYSLVWCSFESFFDSGFEIFRIVYFVSCDFGFNFQYELRLKKYKRKFKEKNLKKSKKNNDNK